MIAWWAVLLFILALQASKWLGRYLLFKSCGTLFENVKKHLFGGERNNEESKPSNI